MDCPRNLHVAFLALGRLDLVVVLPGQHLVGEEPEQTTEGPKLTTDAPNCMCTAFQHGKCCKFSVRAEPCVKHLQREKRCTFSISAELNVTQTVLKSDCPTALRYRSEECSATGVCVSMHDGYLCTTAVYVTCGLRLDHMCV